MRIVIQRVSSASVEAEGRVVCAIDRGLAVLVGIEKADTDADLAWIAGKIAHLRIFEDEQGRMNRSVMDVGGAVLLAPNFTLTGDARHGRRPTFDNAMRPEHAERMFVSLSAAVRSLGVRVEVGVFRATMAIALVNDGPVTIVLESNAAGPESGPPKRTAP